MEHTAATGKVVAVGPGRPGPNGGGRIPVRLSVGDTVFTTKFIGYATAPYGEYSRLRIVDEAELFGICCDEAVPG